MADFTQTYNKQCDVIMVMELKEHSRHNRYRALCPVQGLRGWSIRGSLCHAPPPQVLHKAEHGV